MKLISISLIALAAVSAGCTTLGESLKLGAVTGALAGATSSYAANREAGKPPSVEDLGIGASIGLGLGLITSYFIHRSVSEDRADAIKETEIYFGDLPPSPFVFPSTNSKRGGKR